MIKKWNNFINESNHNKSISLSEDEMNLFSAEPALEELIASRKVTLKNGQVLYDENDSETRDLLDQYLEIPGKLEESNITENISSGLNKDNTLHIIKLHIEDELKKLNDKNTLVLRDNGQEYRKIDNSLSEYESGSLSGRREAYKNVLNMISKFEKLEESWNVYDKTHPNEIVRELFTVFDRSKDRHMDDVRNLINKVSKIQSSSPTKENERYLKELHNYYRTLHEVTPNLFYSIEVKKTV